MKSEIEKEKDGSYTLRVNLELSGGMLEMEEKILEMVNELGLKATLAALKQFDTSGQAIEKGGKSLSSKGAQKKSFKRPMAKES